MEVLLIVIVVATTIWVALDAGQRDWSANQFWKSTETWVFGCLLVWVVAFPVYLVKRQTAPLKTKTV